MLLLLLLLLLHSISELLLYTVGYLTNQKLTNSCLTSLRLKERKCVVVFTHSYAVMQAADVIHVISDGKIVESGPLKDLQTWNPLADL